jgi:heavy metal translocating P-type ATPase
MSRIRTPRLRQASPKSASWIATKTLTPSAPAGANGLAKGSGLGKRKSVLSDIVVTFPDHNRIQFQSESLFSDPGSETFLQFFERAFLAPEVESVEINANKRRGEITLRSDQESSRKLIGKISEFLSHGKPTSDNSKSLVFPSGFAESNEPVVRLHRHGHTLSTWAVKHEIEGRLRLKNPAIYRKRELCQAIERELMNVLGVERYFTNDLTSTVLLYYDNRQIQKHQLIDLLDGVLEKSRDIKRTPADLDLPIATASVALAATSKFLVPALHPISAGVFFYSVIPSYKNAHQVLFKEKRLGVDVLDAIVVTVCLATGQVFAGTVLGWCLSFGRKLVQKTEDNSKKMLLNVFGKQPRFVWLQRDGVEVETPLEKLKIGDIIVVHTGETVPVDGEIVEGMAMIDQHALTGESAPAEKIKDDKVFASTTVLAGKVQVSVTSAGTETTSAKLARILNDTAGYKLRSQSQGEELADKAVVPTLALGALGLATVGSAGAVAVVNCDLGTGIRMAAPIAMLSSLTLAAQHGILVKDGRALELMRKVDTFLFDKTGTLTRERPEVGRILTFGRYSERQILQWAAAAENKFSHPIAKAILDKFQSLGIPLPATDESKYQVGYGITVNVEGHTIRVGSARFLKHEGISLPTALEREMESVYTEGNSLIMVGVDDALGGAIEMCAANRPEAEEVISGLRARGAKHLAIISGDHDRPTRRLAEKLGMDRYFAEVLPQDKAKYVELLQSEGRTVCFIGDGINDSIALKKANVSISLRGASSIATDTAQVVFMEESLAKLTQLYDISQDLQRNINRSWALILAPNILCIGGAFFAGFGVMHSMLFNQVGAIFAVGNGLLPLREVAKAQAEKDRIAEYLASRPGPA